MTDVGAYGDTAPEEDSSDISTQRNRNGSKKVRRNNSAAEGEGHVDNSVLVGELVVLPSAREVLDEEVTTERDGVEDSNQGFVPASIEQEKLKGTREIFRDEDMCGDVTCQHGLCIHCRDVQSIYTIAC